MKSQLNTTLLRPQKGMTLIEIMIALLIGLFLMGGVIQIFLSTKQSYRMQDNLSRLQENARFAMETLSHDVRLAGYLGCSPVTATNPVVIADNPLVAPNPHAGNAAVVAASPISGGDEVDDSDLTDDTGEFTSPYPALWTNKITSGIQPGTDAITVQFAEPCEGYTTAALTGVDVAASLSANATCTTAKGTPLIITDCTKAHVFRASDDTSKNKDATGAATLNLVTGNPAAIVTYPVGSEVMMFRSYTYYIRAGASGEPALWRLDNNMATSGNNPIEVIENVADFQVLYGVDTDGDGVANYFISGTAADVPAADWLKVVSIRFNMTLESIDDGLTTSNDGRLFRRFTSTLAVRNRIN